MAAQPSSEGSKPLVGAGWLLGASWLLGAGWLLVAGWLLLGTSWLLVAGWLLLGVGWQRAAGAGKRWSCQHQGGYKSRENQGCKDFLHILASPSYSCCYSCV